MKKKIIAGMMTCIIACSGFAVLGMNHVEAASYIAENGVVTLGSGTASVTICGNDGQSLVGKKFQVYQLFDLENSVGGESVNYTFNAAYKKVLQNIVGIKLSKNPSNVTEYEVIDYIQSLNQNVVEGADAEQALEGRYSSFRYFVEELRNEIVRLGCDSDIVTVNTTDSDNRLVLNGLEYGYYLVDEVSENSGTHSASSLCLVSNANPEASVYIKSDYPTIRKEIQEDDNQELIGNKGWNTMADFEIGQTVPYRYISNVPNMNGYDTYYYAWHDVMDDALTFQKDSVKIVISDGTKQYAVAADEFIVTESANRTSAFKVAIGDIKAIVDREFNQMDALGHNTYGQTVTLTYNAVLNDHAAEDTGRPGFENDVRLEFSNDADSTGEGKTGFTPWDTVVCFTYKLDVMKTNNHDLILPGAKFRLYSDEACEHEVYVKKTATGYNVINRDSVAENVPVDAVEMISNAKGNFVIYGLDDGTYYLKETDAPAGYRLIEDPIKLNIDASFVEDRDNYIKGEGATDRALMNIEYSAYIKQFLSGTYEESAMKLESDADEGVGNLTVINHVGMKLPITGSFGTVLMVVFGTASMALGIKISRKNYEDFT